MRFFWKFGLWFSIRAGISGTLITPTALESVSFFRVELAIRRFAAFDGAHSNAAWAMVTNHFSVKMLLRRIA